MQKGDHIKVKRSLYFHHGIYIGDNTVVHFTGEPFYKLEAKIRRSTIFVFLEGGEAELVQYGKCQPIDYTIKIAESHIGKSGYNLVFNNCEHFATFCKTGKAKSEQVNDAVTSTSTTLGVTTTASLGITGVSVAGVSGLSGAGIMSGLSVIGGSTIGGIGVLAAAPALIANIGINKLLADDENLTEEERQNRTAGRIGAKVGTMAGAVGTVGTISAAGVTAGLSGAGITSGLAAIGGTVGGGMLTGTAIAIAAPAAAAVALGYGIYKIFSWFND